VHATQPLVPGELIRCRIIEADGYDLLAQPVAELEAHVSLPVVQ